MTGGVGGLEEPTDWEALSTPVLFILSATSVEYFSVWSTMKLRCWSSAFFLFSSNMACCLYSTNCKRKISFKTLRVIINWCTISLREKHPQDKHITFLNKFNKIIRLMHNMKGDYHLKKCMILAHVKVHSTHCWTTYLLPKNSEKHWYLSSQLQHI